MCFLAFSARRKMCWIHFCICWLGWRLSKLLIQYRWVHVGILLFQHWYTTSPTSCVNKEQKRAVTLWHSSGKLDFLCPLNTAKVSQSILCIFFLMYVATIQCLNYSEQVCKTNNLLLFLTNLWPCNKVKVVKPGIVISTQSLKDFNETVLEKKLTLTTFEQINMYTILSWINFKLLVTA